MTTGKRLALVSVVLVGVTGYMAYLGAAGSWKYYVSVDECLARQSTYAGQRIRVSGRVAADTLQIAKDRKHADFSLKGEENNLPVVFSGTLPDNFAADREVVAEGYLEAPATLRCDKLLTQCASKYESKADAQRATGILPVQSSSTGKMPVAPSQDSPVPPSSTGKMPVAPSQDSHGPDGK